MENLFSQKQSGQDYYIYKKQSNKEMKNIFTPIDLIFISSLIARNDAEYKNEEKKDKLNTLDY